MRSIIVIAAVLLLCACSKEVNIAEPYKLGQYHVTQLGIEVSPRLSSSSSVKIDDEFIAAYTGIRIDLQNRLSQRLAEKTLGPALGMTVQLKELHATPTCGVYYLAAHIELWEQPNHINIAQADVKAGNPPLGAGSAVGSELACKMAGSLNEMVLNQFVASVMGKFYPSQN